MNAGLNNDYEKTQFMEKMLDILQELDPDINVQEATDKTVIKESLRKMLSRNLDIV